MAEALEYLFIKSESKAEVIELHDDNACAVRAILKYLYGFLDEWKAFETDRGDVRYKFWMDLCIAADKYLVFDLKTSTLEALQRHAQQIEHVDEAARFLDALDEKLLLLDAGAEAMWEHVADRFMPALLKEPSFRARLDRDKSLMWQYLDDYAALQRGTLSYKSSSSSFSPSGFEFKDEQSGEVRHVYRKTIDMVWGFLR